MSAFGAIRRLPQLLYQGKDANQGKVKNLKNIALNSPVQNYEICLIMMTLNKTHDTIKENMLKSVIVGSVHDSMVFYTHKDEVSIINRITKSEFEKDRPENKGIPFELEIELSKPDAEFGSEYYYEDEKGDIQDHRYWGFGKEIK
jgi:DNA polymerase I-like protein with 3'-5' exonuclease and polymerase domains